MSGIRSTVSLPLILIWCSLIVGLSFLLSGCGHRCTNQSENTPLFVPVTVEYKVNVHEQAVEKTLTKVLRDTSCMLAHAGDKTSPYVLQISYRKVTDLKTTLLYVLSLSMAELPADFWYTLEIRILKNGELCKEYQYHRLNRETTDPLVSSVLNPLHDSHAASKKIFTALAEEFLSDLTLNPPCRPLNLLPPIPTAPPPVNTYDLNP